MSAVQKQSTLHSIDTSTLTFVTGNANKLKEIVAILSTSSDGSHPKVGKYVITNQAIDLDELQGTIDQVTIHKAKSAAAIVNGPVIVEDTCLGFNAFNDLPGPYIKWFVKSLGLEGIVNMLYKFDDKGAKAITTIGYCEGPDAEVQLFQGITEGTIVSSRGNQNFGWDSIFQPNGHTQTYAEMDKEVKNGLSHRFKALDKLRDFLLAQ